MQTQQQQQQQQQLLRHRPSAVVGSGDIDVASEVSS
jgi:hypothetical protein